MLPSAGNKKKTFPSQTCCMDNVWQLDAIGMKGHEYLMSEIKAINVQAIFSPKNKNLTFHWKSLQNKTNA